MEKLREWKKIRQIANHMAGLGVIGSNAHTPIATPCSMRPMVSDNDVCPTAVGKTRFAIAHLNAAVHMCKVT